MTKRNALSALDYRPGQDRRGRPLTPAQMRKIEIIPFRATRLEKAALVKWANAEDVSLGALIRRVLFTTLLEGRFSK